MMEFPENFNFPKEEEDTLQYWAKIKAFETSLEQSKNNKKYSFYDGPPFATGLPHYGHILAGSIKDIVTRYAHQTGFHVERRFGWDCHGLPVEYEIDKKLGIKGSRDVEKMGITAYNGECRAIVMKYSREWEEIVTRLGRWIDFKNDYKTMYPSFMESVWFVFKQIFDKGMVYRGFKVMPFSTACSTPMSNFEAKQNFKDVDDPSVVVSFPFLDDPDVELLAWTTTPWTLPSNLAICVNSSFVYVKVQEVATNRIFILLECRLSTVFKKADQYNVLTTLSGKSLENKQYLPLFDYYGFMRAETGAFRVLCDDYVTQDSGTGVVHQAPYFGEDDFRICSKYGIITSTSTVVCPVDERGHFTSIIKDFEGRYVKEADKDIMKVLKAKNRLIKQGTERHSYPFCWRSDTPLLYKAVSCWFIRVEQISDQLLASNAETYWVPDFVKESRFANWLRDARDWAVSRNRYWGTPLPLWVSEDFEEIVCVGSIEELWQLSGVRVRDLHRESVDDIVIPSRTNRGVLRRIPEVFDCWFESGSMPYAQVHFPFSVSMKQFTEIFPADFIAEGIDQTRGWFYTLTVISTILFGKSPYKNLIVNGIINAEDGQKMSKRLKNYPDPCEVVNKYGADALRLYLINSPVVRAQNLRFQESGVKDILKDVFLPWYNAFKFLFLSSITPYEQKMNNGAPVLFKASEAPKTDNVMDLWIISFTQSLIKYFREQMRLYRLDTVIPRLVKYIDHLTNYYVRMNRRRLRGETVVTAEDWLAAIHTLFFVLYQTTVMLSPFVPFITEFFYQKLRQRLDCTGETSLKIGIDAQNRPESVHYLMIPACNDALINRDIEESVSLMQTVVELGRKIRDQRTLALKAPLSEVVIVAEDLSLVSRVRLVESYVLEELNVRTMTISTDKHKYGVELKAELNHRLLGAKLKKDYQTVLKESKGLSTKQLEEFQRCGEIVIAGHVLTSEDIEVIATVNTGSSSSSTGDDAASSYVSISSPDGILVLLDCHQSPDLLQESLARELINRIQRRRKELSLVPSDPLTIHCWTDNADLRAIFESHKDMIQRVVQQPIIVSRPSDAVLSQSQCSILGDGAGVTTGVKDDKLSLWFLHDHSAERLRATDRQCQRIDCRSVTINGHRFELAGFDTVSSLLRHVRLVLGWTDFGGGPLVLRGDDGKEVDERSVAALGGRSFQVSSR